MTYKEHLDLWTTHAEKKFSDFEAKLTQHDGISVLDWKNKYGAGDYYMRVIFDEDKERMFISGDLGNAVFQFTEKATLFRIARYSSFPYFFEKLSCTTDRWRYDYDSAKEELKERLKWEEMIEAELEEADELIGDIMDNYDQYGNGSYLTEELRERLSEVDPEYYTWVYSLGERPHPRVIIWWQALKLAARQIEEPNGEAEEVVLAEPPAQHEQRTGHWFDVGSLSCRCSECGCKNNRETVYCPTCGAKMELLLKTAVSQTISEYVSDNDIETIVVV